MAEHEQPAAILISRDLFFTSKVTGTAVALGIRLQVVGDVQAAARLGQNESCRCVFIDLADEAVDVAAFFQQFPATHQCAVVAFGSHVQTERLQAARDAGCTDVLPRSRFSAELPQLLQQYCGR